MFSFFAKGAKVLASPAMNPAKTTLTRNTEEALASIHYTLNKKFSTNITGPNNVPTEVVQTAKNTGGYISTVKDAKQALAHPPIIDDIPISTAEPILKKVSELTNTPIPKPRSVQMAFAQTHAKQINTGSYMAKTYPITLDQHCVETPNNNMSSTVRLGYDGALEQSIRQTYKANI
jgi:hypothetical protein